MTPQYVLPRRLIFCVFLPVLLLACLPARPADSPDCTFVGISVAAGKNITQSARNAAVFQFGSRSLPDPGMVQAVFTLKNETRRPIILDRLQPTCHCTEAEPVLPSEGMPTLPPGGGLDIRVVVALAGHPTGALLKSVYVFVDGQAEPAARLDMAGTLLEENHANHTH